ncbi:hypothetical protein Agub_g16026, partial [Astrephomene gubernaculifera]
LSARAALQPLLSVESLTDLYAVYKSVPFNYALAGHCLFVAALAPDFRRNFLMHFWVTFLAGFGGGIVSSLLMMDPARAPVNILANNTVGLTWVACWWLMAYSPFDIVNRVHSFLPFRMVTKACVAFMRAQLIMNRVDLAVSLYPGVLLAPLILGSIAGSGGKLITDAVRACWGRLPGAPEAAVPSFVWRSAFLASAAYYGSCKASSLLSSQEAAALIITVMLVHSVLSDLLGAARTDFTYPLAWLLHKISLIPMPSDSPAPAVAAAKPAKQPSQAPKQQQPQQQPQQQAAKQGAASQAAPAATSKQQQQAGSGTTAPGSKSAAQEPGKNGKAAAAAVKADSSSAASHSGNKKGESKKKR